MEPVLALEHLASRGGAIGRRTVAITAAASAIGVAAAAIAVVLVACLALVTNLAFYGEWSLAPASPAGNQLGGWVVVVPVAGALLVGLMARYGTKAIRGHGIPEAMEQVLFNESRIPARVLFMKPLSAVVSIGTGGPFGAEGPIIATGGALGSLVGQFVKITADERKILLASGAAAGMSATFGSPVAAVLLAVELLLFEYRASSLIPVAFAASAAAAVRIAVVGTAPAFSVGVLAQPAASAIVAYVAVGAVIGVLAVIVTKAVYAVEDAFARLPIHWMWWPALGAVVVGVIGYFAPRTMGVGYDNIEGMVSGGLTGTALYTLCALKLVSWLFSLGSGTSGGTLAPLFTVGGGAGAAVASLLALAAPGAGIDPRLGALVGMAAMFAGASRAPLASVVFAFETTRQAVGLLPLLGGCCAAYLIACVMAKHSIMTEKIARQGRPVPTEYTADFLTQVLVRDIGCKPVTTLPAEQTVAEARRWLAESGAAQHHNGFPVVAGDALIGVVTRRELFASSRDPLDPIARVVSRPPVVIGPEASARAAADLMLRESVGRLPVVAGGRLVGVVTRSDLLQAHSRRLASEHHVRRVRKIGPRRAT
ncbi:MAG: chloride channel protein [Myxococcales bacterium]|nr:chloride channel protein [Myxococcales bacterium]MCB9734564.1 chloride channel protein [Deltaproteobacteria bacterium]